MKKCLYYASCGMMSEEDCRHCEYFFFVSDCSDGFEPDNYQYATYYQDLKMRSEEYLKVIKEYE